MRTNLKAEDVEETFLRKMHRNPGGGERALGAVLGRDPEGSAGINFFLRKKNSLFYLVMNPSLFLDNETVFVDLSDSQYWTHNFHKRFEAEVVAVFFFSLCLFWFEFLKL